MNVDYEGNLYFLEGEDSKSNKLNLYKMDESNNLIKGNTLDVRADNEDILINSKGSIFADNKSLGVITRLKDNKEYKYQGNILNVYDNGFYTTFDNRLIQYKSDF